MTNSAQASAVVAEVGQKLQHAHRVLLVAHIRPDGDAVGALIGLGLALVEAGKEIRLVLADGVPYSLRFLEGSARVHHNAGDLSRFDLTVVLDCSDLQRTGGVLGERVPDVNIDHHITNLHFAATNLVIPEQVATSAIVAEYLPQWGLGYNKAIASALLTGIVTDTLGFRTSNVIPEALRLAAMLMEHGANLPELYDRALTSKTFEAARFWGFGLDKLHQEKAAGHPEGDTGRFVWTTLTLEDRKAAGYPGNDDADLVNVLSSIDADAAVIFVEQKNGHVKVSWRARPGYDVSQIALQFGGGGHAAAAGADIPGTLDTVQNQVLDATRDMLVQTYATKNRKKPVQA